jgi:hypothetical protein
MLSEMSHKETYILESYNAYIHKSIDSYKKS